MYERDRGGGGLGGGEAGREGGKQGGKEILRENLRSWRRNGSNPANNLIIAQRRCAQEVCCVCKCEVRNHVFQTLHRAHL